jgi:hypothetical protein
MYYSKKGDDVLDGNPRENSDVLYFLMRLPAGNSGESSVVFIGKEI